MMMRVQNFLLLRWIIVSILFFCLTIQYARAEFRIGWKNQVDVTNLIQLDKKHQTVGRDSITWLKYDNDQTALHNLSINKVDAVPVDMTTFLSAVTFGLQARIIAVDRQYGADSALLVRNQSQISKADQLIGKKIAVSFMTSNHYSLLRYLQHADIPIQKVTLINMKPDQIVQAWQKGTIDGAYIDGLPAIQFEKDGHVLVNSEQIAAWGYPTYQVWVVMDEIIPDQPYLLQDFVDRILKQNKEFRQEQSKLTLQSPQVVQLVHLLAAPPEATLALLKKQTYPTSSQQSLILSRHLSKNFNNMALFLRTQHIMPDMLADYLMYVYETFVLSSKIK